jgi:hypothetical protein
MLTWEDLKGPPTRGFSQLTPTPEFETPKNSDSCFLIRNHSFRDAEYFFFIQLGSEKEAKKKSLTLYVYLLSFRDI